MNCIYRIECNDKEIKEIYIGSTCNLYRRKKEHGRDSKRYNFKVYKFISENGGWDNWSVVVEQECESLSTNERKLLEQTYIELLEPELNTYNANGFDVIAYQKEWSKVRNKKIVICDNCGTKISDSNIARHKKTKRCINFNSHHQKL